MKLSDFDKLVQITVGSRDLTKYPHIPLVTLHIKVLWYIGGYVVKSLEGCFLSQIVFLRILHLSKKWPIFARLKSQHSQIDQVSYQMTHIVLRRI